MLFVIISIVNNRGIKKTVATSTKKTVTYGTTGTTGTTSTTETTGTTPTTETTRNTETTKKSFSKCFNDYDRCLEALEEAKETYKDYSLNRTCDFDYDTYCVMGEYSN